MAYDSGDMKVVTTQVQRGPTVVSAGNRDWSSDVFDVCDDGQICALGFFCGPCYACYLSQKLGEHCCVPLLGGCGHHHLLGGVVSLRLKVRMMLGIRGSICGDCCCLYWCGTCTLCQMAREMKAAGWPL